MFLTLAQKWLELANGHFGLRSFHEGRLSSAIEDFNDKQMRGK